MSVKPERKLWHELKAFTPKISWTRIENTGSFGTPDLLGYNNFGHFFTLELKVTKTNILVVRKIYISLLFLEGIFIMKHVRKELYLNEIDHQHKVKKIIS